MIVQSYNKLVRDNIPSFIARDRQIGHFHTMTEAEYVDALERKLSEEVSEFLESKENVELADILEVVQALAEHNGISFEQLLDIKEEKRNRCGAFKSRLFLETIDIPVRDDTGGKKADA